MLNKDFALVWLATFGLYLGHQGIVPTLPLFVRSAGGDPTTIGTISGAYMATSAVVAFLSPWLLAVARPRRLIVLAVPLMALGTAGYLLPLSLVGVGVLTMMRGAAFGLANTAMVLVVVDAVPAPQRATGIGVYQFAVSLASVAGMTLGLWVIASAGFDMIVIVTTIVLMAGAASLVVAGEHSSDDLPERLGLRVAMRLPGIGPPTLIFLTLTMVYGAVVTFTAVFLGEGGAGDAVIFFGLAMSAQVVARPASGRLSEHFRAATVAVFGFASVALSVALLAVAPEATVYLAAILFGLGFGAGVVAIQVLVMAADSPSARAAASSLFSVAYAGGMGLGALIFGAVVDQWGHRWAYAGMAVVLIPGLVSLLRSDREALTAAQPLAR